MILAIMWNALAGYGGLVSVGQQAFIGFGAYGTIFLTQHGVSPLPRRSCWRRSRPPCWRRLVSLLVLRLRGGQFAVGTWVVAETLALLVVLDQDWAAERASRCAGLNGIRPQRPARLHLLDDAGVHSSLAPGLLFLLLRSKTGAALQAIRDDEDAAASLGVRVRPLEFVLFVLAGFGCGAAGALILANTLFIQPQSIFGVQYSAYMIFMVLVGGLGTFEGPDPRCHRLLRHPVRVRRPGCLVPHRTRCDRGAASRCSCPRGLWSLSTRSAARPAAAGWIPAHATLGSYREPGEGGGVVSEPGSSGRSEPGFAVPLQPLHRRPVDATRSTAGTYESHSPWTAR